ncbi:MAG: hypothetical protein AAGE92_07405 [Cyanobacteria bacterium P01_G01_bin.4]
MRDRTPLTPSIAELLEDLQASPLEANLSAIWPVIEPQLSTLTVENQLKLVGTIVETLASIHATKAELLLSDWHEAHNTEGPILNDDCLAGLARQTTYLDVSALCRSAKRISNHASPDITIEEIEKQTALQFAEEPPSASPAELQEAPREDIATWSRMLQTVLSSTHQPLSLQALVDRLQDQHLTWSEILMTLLLSRNPEFTLQGSDSFYCSFEELTISAALQLPKAA